MPLVDALLPEFDHEMTVTRKLLERVPDDVFDWKPHPKSMSLGALAQHLANIPMWGIMTLTRDELDLGGPQEGPPPPQTRTALLERFDAHVKDARTALVGTGDGEMMAPWALTRGGQTIFSMPRAAVWRSFVLSHLVHHRGQLSVYLRLRDVPVPSIYGPSADEGSM